MQERLNQIKQDKMVVKDEIKVKHILAIDD